MNKKEILKKLQEKNKNFRLPSEMDFTIQDNVLIIEMTEKGLISNMQTDAAAFEGWAVCLKAWLPNLINQVVITGHTPKDILNKHYQRFLYRLDKFLSIYSWVSTNTYKKELDNYKDKNRNIVINVPKSNASESAAHCEAQLERKFCKENEKYYDVIDHQLPVRLFIDEIKEKNAITPKSYLDIWSIKDDVLRIFELKLPTNTEIGIISELMFYVNVMTDVVKGDVTIPFSNKYRSFKQLYDFRMNNKCQKIEGIMLADNLHFGIKDKLNDILQIINEGKFKFNIEYLYEKIKLVDTTIINGVLKENNDMKKELSYKSMQKKKQLTLLQHTDFFENAIGCGVWWNTKKKLWETYPHILQHQDSLKNLFGGVRRDVLAYFNEYDIAWWRENEDRYFPTGHLLSSQIHCLNHLFALRNDKDAVLAILNHVTEMGFDEVLPSIIDDGGYISFEFTYKNDEILGENDKGARRGVLCTSVDAMIYARKGKDKWLIPIEWKYTESYEKEDKTNDTRLNRYGAGIIESRRLKTPKNGIAHSIYFQEPSYELMRQTILTEGLINRGLANNMFHLVVIPERNKVLRDAVEKEFVPMLEPNSKFRIIDPHELLAPIEDNDNYSDLITYLKTRYW